MKKKLIIVAVLLTLAIIAEPVKNVYLVSTNIKERESIASLKPTIKQTYICGGIAYLDSYNGMVIWNNKHVYLYSPN